MKKIYVSGITLLFFSFLMFAVTSCKKNGFLSGSTTNNLDKTSVFKDSANTNQFLASIYLHIGDDVVGNEFSNEQTGLGRLTNGGIDAACDESQPNPNIQSDANYWQTGNINAIITTPDIFNMCYQQIRAVNLLLANINKTNLKLVSGPGSRTQLKAEARFLRAWYYAMLLRHYGGVPIVKDSLFTYTDKINESRATFAATVKYITSECDSAAKNLPYTQPDPYYGRATIGACAALKARVLLMAASPLYSVSGNIAGNSGELANPTLAPLTGYVGADSSAYRWTLARDASKAIIDAGLYGLAPNLKTFFAIRGNPSISPQENILQWMLPGGSGSAVEQFWDPPTRSGGGGGYPYQEDVDMFPMRDGKAIDDASSAYTYNPQDPYKNRDPRLDLTIMHDQTVLVIWSHPGQYSPLDIHYNITNGTKLPGSADAIGSAGATITGYYVHKMVDSNSTGSTLIQNSSRCQPLIRYTEILLNYAEAENEVNGPDAAVYQQLIAIRKRAGIQAGDGYYGLKAGMSQSEMRTAIQLERRLELAYEGFRFWDIRRWKIADATQNQQFHGINVNWTYTSSGVTKSYSTFPIVPLHTFATRMYFWPFPYLEVGKTAIKDASGNVISSELLQNPGY